jgi:hypothetical protein
VDELYGVFFTFAYLDETSRGIGDAPSNNIWRYLRLIPGFDLIGRSGQRGKVQLFWLYRSFGQ